MNMPTYSEAMQLVSATVIQMLLDARKDPEELAAVADWMDVDLETASRLAAAAKHQTRGSRRKRTRE